MFTTCTTAKYSTCQWSSFPNDFPYLQIFLLPAIFQSQTLYCLGLKKCIWILASTSSSDIEALPKRSSHAWNPLSIPVSTPGNTLMHVKSLTTELHWHMLYRAGANYSQVVYAIPYI